MVGALALLAAAGCAGRWLEVSGPNPRMLRDPYPRDYRAVLRNDSVLVLRGAIARNDSLVEVAFEQTKGKRQGPARGVALDDVVHLEQWQESGERVVGGTALGLVTGVVAWLVIVAVTWRS